MRLKQLREEKKLSQIEFGRIFQAAQNTVSNWERGTREIPQETLIQMADYFDVSVDYLLGRADIKKAPAEAEAKLSSTQKELMLLARKAEELPKEQRDRLIKNFADTIDIYFDAINKEKK